MKSLASLLALALSLPALAAEAPIPPPGHRHLVLNAGDPAPSTGLFADEELARYDLDRVHWLEAYAESCTELKVTETKPLIPWWAWFAAGALLGGGGVYLAKH